MLFDLRARGRRRAIQVIYLLLAILMGGGLVLFGIGGEVDGGLLSGIGQGGGSSVSEISKKQLADAERKVRADRSSPEAWGELARVRVSRATSVGFDQNQRAFTDEGKAELAKADQAWQQVLRLTDKPDRNVAALMVQAYGDGALEQFPDAVKAFEIVMAGTEKPTSDQYARLAVLAYQAGQNRKGDLAAARAVQLAPKAQRKNLRQQLEQVKTQILTESLKQSQSGTSTTISP